MGKCMLNKKPHILFLFSDTGGGHRSATEAIIEALHLEFDDSFTAEMGDFFKSYAPLRFNRVPAWWPEIVQTPPLWSASFPATDGRARARMITTTMWPAVRHAARHLIES